MSSMIGIFHGKQFIQLLRKDAWIYQTKDDEYFKLLDGSLDVETSIANWNLNQECKGSEFRAVILSADELSKLS